MKILVTGGAGYIGSHAVLDLLQNGYDVVIFDNVENGHREAIDAIGKYSKKKVSFVKGDLRNKADIQKVFDAHTIDAVMHFAGYIEVGESVLQPLKYYENNVYGSLNLFEAMLAHNVKKIVFSSTAAIYGKPEVAYIAEDIIKNPINPYGRSKLMVEQILDDLHVSDGMDSIRLRYFNVVGASKTGIIGEAHAPESHLVPNALLTAAGKKESFTMFGTNYKTPDGTCVRDYVHVEDLINAHVLALKKLDDGDICESMNLGSKTGFSVKEILETCKEVSGVDFTIIIGERRAGDPDTLIADSSKAKRILGWEQKKTLTDMIQSAWTWHNNHPNGYDTN